MGTQLRGFVMVGRILAAALLLHGATHCGARAEFIGIDFGPGSSTPINWNTSSGGSSPITLENLLDESGSQTAVDLVMTSTDGFFTATTGSPPAGQIPSRVPPIAGIEGSIFTSTNANYTFQDLNPLERYNVWLFNLDTVSGNSVNVTITGDGTPTNFTSNFAANELYVNGVLGSSSLGLESYAITVPADSSGAISIDLVEATTASWTGTGGLAIAPVSELIGVDFGPGSSTPNSWNTFNGTSPVNNLVNEAGDFTSVSLTTSPSSLGTANSSPPSTQIPAHSQSLAGVEGNTFSSSDSIYLIGNLNPYEKYQVNVLATDTIANTIDVTITGHGLPAKYQVSHSANELYVNGELGDSSRTLDSYAYTIAASSGGEIVIDVDNVGTWGGLAGVTVTPNAALVGIDFGPLATASPTNWTSADGSFTSATNLINEGGDQTAIDLTYSGESLTATLGNPPAGQFPAHGQSLADLAGNVWEGNPGTFTFSDLDPLRAYEVWVFGLDTFAGTVDVTITGDGAPVNYEISYSTNQLYANDAVGDSTKTLDEFAYIVNASSTGEIAIDLVEISSFWGLAGLAIREFVPLTFDNLPGDFDQDGDVDGTDFLLWQRGGSPHPLSASDLADWEANYGMVAPLAATATAAPEPATALMLTLGMATMLFRREVVVS